jgi:hypothetical protein|tara:strand:+ start:37 stop:798 length:762 start_codon:yes stop_codon:yes gene_type:complete
LDLVAKRFIDTGLFRKKWIRQLDPNMKLFWIYLLTDCDHAGIWDVDVERASFQLKVELDESEILNTFNRKIVPFKPGKWFVPKFIVYQYGELNESNRAHNSVIKILTKYKLYKGLTRGLQGPMDMDKDMDKVKDKEGKKEQLETIKSNLSAYSEKYPALNIQFYYDSFVDWLDATGKQYKKYDSAFNNCCRSEWYKDRPGSTKADAHKSTDITIACPNGHHQRTAKRGVRGVCPKCRENLRPTEEIALKRAIA